MHCIIALHWSLGQQAGGLHPLFPPSDPPVENTLKTFHYQRVSVGESQLEWCFAVVVLRCRFYITYRGQILHYIQVPVATGVVKRCASDVVSAHCIAVLLCDEILDHVDVTTAAGVMQRRPSNAVLALRVAALLANEILHHFSVAASGCVVQRSVSVAITAIDAAAERRHQVANNIHPAVVSREMQQGDALYCSISRLDSCWLRYQDELLHRCVPVSILECAQTLFDC